MVGALAAVNAAGRVTRGAGRHFWAASYERGAEFGGLGEGPRRPDQFDLALSSDAPANTTLVVVATDAPFDKARLTRLAIMAAAASRWRSARPSVLAMATYCSRPRRAAADKAPSLRDLIDIGALAAECAARAIARAVYEAARSTSPAAAGLEGQVSVAVKILPAP